MLIWSGWGIVVAIFMALGLLLTFALHDLLQQFLPYGPAGSLSVLISGALSAFGIALLAKWGERRATRFSDEQAGNRGVTQSAGALFFIPIRFWSWIVLLLALALAVLQFRATPT